MVTDHENDTIVTPVADNNSYVLLDSIAQNKFPFFTREKYHDKEDSLIKTLLTTEVNFGDKYGSITYEDARKKLQVEIDAENKDEDTRLEQMKNTAWVEAVNRAVNKAVEDKPDEVKAAVLKNLPSNNATTQAVETAVETAVKTAVEAAAMEAAEMQGKNVDTRLEEMKNTAWVEAVNRAVNKAVEDKPDEVKAAVLKNLPNNDATTQAVETAVETAVKTAMEAAAVEAAAVGGEENEVGTMMTIERADNNMKTALSRHRVAHAKTIKKIADLVIRSVEDTTKRTGVSAADITDAVDKLDTDAAVVSPTTMPDDDDNQGSVEDNIKRMVKSVINNVEVITKKVTEREKVEVKRLLIDAQDKLIESEAEVIALRKDLAVVQAATQEPPVDLAEARAGGGSKKNVSKKRRNTKNADVKTKK